MNQLENNGIMVEHGIETRRAALSDAQRALLQQRLRGEPLAHKANPAISRRPDRSRAPLSFAQQRLWFIHQLEPHSPLYNVPVALRLEGPLNRPALQQALDAILVRHEILRTRFVARSGEPEQVIAPAEPVELRLIDLQPLPAEERTRRLTAELDAESSRPFDLARDAMLRGALLHLGGTEHVLLLVMHHIASDGWSWGVFFRELAVLYGAAIRGEQARLPDLPVQYADYAVWHRDWLRSPAMARQLAYWKNHLAGAPEFLALPANRRRPHVQTFKGEWRRQTLPGALTERLQQLGRREGATRFMLLLAAFKTLLHRYTGQTDLIVGTPVAGRTQVQTENQIGFFVNTLPLRTRCEDDPTFLELLQRVRQVTLDALSHQELPFDRLVEELRPERSPDHSPLIQVMFVLQTAPGSRVRLPGLQCTLLQTRTRTAKFDLTLCVEEHDTDLVAGLEYNADLFDPATADRILRHFQLLLEGIAAQPGRHLSELPLLTAPEKHELLVDWNRTTTPFPNRRTVHALFEEQVERTPDAVALEADNEQLTYAELNARANHLARLLARHRVGPDVPVALCAERSVSLIVALLGILKAGGAYVSLDPAYPKQRLADMLLDAWPPVVLVQNRFRHTLPDPADLARRSDSLNHQPAPLYLDLEAVTIIAPDPDPQPGPAHNRAAHPVTAENLAYISYTSGSTGRPKGVCIPHRAVARLLFETDYIRIGPGHAVAQISNCAFDASTFEIWGALLQGARLVIVPAPTVLSPADFGRLLATRGVTELFVTTALFNQLSQDAPGIFRGLRTLLFGGETVNPACVLSVLRNGPPQRLLHVYGPTETTTFATWHEVRTLEPDAATVPIGRPLANTELYVLDRHRQPVPVGVPGELYIGGPGLARGYLNQPELTAEAFVPHPFNPDPGARLYQTGDLVRYRPDGQLEFIGRSDQQIKLRGFRVELGEIEAALARHPAVRECVVRLLPLNGPDHRLVAYVVSRQTPGPADDELRRFLRTRLPEVMIPAAFMVLPALPLNANGKVDRAALPMPAPSRSDHQGRFVSPQDPLERQLAAIWEDVLGVRPVGLQDNFFDLGGHSLLAVRLIARVEQALGKTLPVSSIFQSPVLDAFIQHVRNHRPDGLRTHPGSSLIAIQPHGTRPPLFLVHGAGGGMFWGYTNLATHLGPDQPVYAFQSPGWTGGEECETLTEMAAHYVADLRAFHPDGPCHLGGYCFGGNVAHEMARQLQSQNRPVASLILLNSAPPRSTYDRIRITPGWALQFLRNLAYIVDCFARRSAAERRGFVAWQWRILHDRLRRFLTPRRDPNTIPAAERVDLTAYTPEERRIWESHIRALFAHQTGTCAAPVTLLRSRGHPLWCSFDHTYGWSEFVSGQLSVEIVPGAHEQILEEPHVAPLAQAIRRAINGASPATATASPHLHPPGDLPCLHQLVEKQAARTPAALAVTGRGQELTYGELDHRANRLAGRLQALGIGPDVLAGLWAEPSPATFVALLAILKTGGACLPLDPADTPDHRRRILDRTPLPVLFGPNHGQRQLALEHTVWIALEEAVADPAPTPAEDRPRLNALPEGGSQTGSTPGSLVNPDHLAFVIHSSGSSASTEHHPLPHRTLIKRLNGQLTHASAAPATRTLQAPSLASEAALQEVFSTWASGGTLALPDQDPESTPTGQVRSVAHRETEQPPPPPAKPPRNGDGSSTRSTLVAIQPQGAQPPLFLVHTAADNRFSPCANLAKHLGDNQPVYGFAPAKPNPAGEPDSIAKLAAQYLADLRAFRPAGPYLLGGCAFGGNVAYEIARLLVAQGESVGLLALFDSFPPRSGCDRIRPALAKCREFVNKLACGARLYPGHPAHTHPGAGQARAYLNHRHLPYPGAVLLFRSRSRPLLGSSDSAGGWRALARGGVDVRHVPGSHKHILEEPHVQTVARELKTILEGIPAWELEAKAL